MRNINKYILTGSIFASMFFGACKKAFLDQKPFTSVSPADALKTAADLQIALTGTYAQLRRTNLYGRTLPVFGDLLADNIFLSKMNSGRYIPENNYSVTIDDSDVTGIWKDSYTAILRANYIIDAALNEGAAVNQSKGEAYAIRALLYFNLVKLYGKSYSDEPASFGVPIVLHYEPTALPQRNSVEEVYAQILSDLDHASTLMTVYAGSGTFSKYAALALAAKVNLYKGDNQKAFDKAEEVITSSGFTLVTKNDLAGYWEATTPHDAGSKVETLFEVVSNGVTNNGYDELSNIFVQGGGSYGDLLTTKSLYDSYGTADVRKNLIIKGVRDKTGAENPAFIVNKYSSVTGDFNDKKVIRLSEVYLVAAEAAQRLNDTEKALKYLKALVAERDPSLIYSSSGAQLLTDILQERRKELAFEGDRFFDLNRLKADINRTPEYSTGVIKFGDFRRVMPIPQDETKVNTGISQNDGYGK